MNKTAITTALIIATIAMGAQTMKKACIKIEKDENGKVTKIDTCVTAATDEELQQKLNAIGFGEDISIPEIPPVPPVPPVPPAPGEEVTMTKVIVIDDGEDEGTGSKKSGKSKKVKVVSSGSGEDAEVIVMDGEGNIIKSGAGSDGNVVIKQLKPGDKMDPEIEKLLKENGVEGGKCEGKKIVIKNSENKNGKESGEVKVYVFSKVEVKKLSEEDRKQLPADANKTISKATPFNDLVVSPNPTEDACNITYKSKSKDPLQIKVYDANGKTVYTETDSNVSDQMNKTLSLKELGKGVYFVHLTQSKQSEVRKVIVK